MSPKNEKNTLPAEPSDIHSMGREELISEVERLRDVAKRREEAEKLLEEAERRFHAVLRSANDAIVMIDDTGKTAIWNNAAERIFGYSAEEMLGREIADFIIPPRYLERHREGVRKFRETGKARYYGKTLELSALRKGGEEFPIEISFSSSPVRFHDRWHAIAIIRDIAKRKLAEEKLGETLAEMEIILENAGVGITLAKQGKFVWMNKGLRDMLGYGKEEIAGLGLGDVFPMEGDYQKTLERVIPLMSGGETVILETNIKRKDGSLFWGRRVVKAVDPGDISRGFIAIVEDFSVRRRMEDELRDAKERAEEATRIKDKFVSMVAHDLRSPFTAILGFLGIVEKDKNNPLHPKHRDFVQRAVASGRNLLNMIEQLLNISRLQSGKIELSPRFIDAYMVIHTSTESLVFHAENKGIEIKSEIPKKTRIFADYNLLGEVIQNLVSNAIKFCEKGDGIRIYMPEEREGVIVVKDTGTGIKSDMLPDLFRHEVRTTTKGTAGEKGTGLGLPFCYDIMKAHGGNLSVTSKEGEGTSFFVELPVVHPVILVVDDDDDARFIFSEGLRDEGYTVLEAVDAVSAMDIIKEHSPHLTLLDLEMPEDEGLRLIGGIRSDEDIGKLPVIVVSAVSDDKVRRSALKAGADDFVTKPLVMEDLMPRIRRFLR